MRVQVVRMADLLPEFGYTTPVLDINPGTYIFFMSNECSDSLIPSCNNRAGNEGEIHRILRDLLLRSKSGYVIEVCVKILIKFVAMRKYLGTYGRFIQFNIFSLTSFISSFWCTPATVRWH